MSRFQKGQSGNPTGRPRGIPSPATKLRKAIEQDIPDIIAALVNAAKQGDTTAARILLDRVVPPLRPQGMPVTVPIGESLSETGRAILDGAGTGQIPPEQASALLAGLGMLARVVETDELIERIEALESKPCQT